MIFTGFLPVLNFHNAIIGLYAATVDNPLDVVTVLGNLGLAGFLIWLFVSGKLEPENHVLQRIQDATKVAQITATKEFTDAIRSAVKDGVREAMMELKVEGYVLQADVPRRRKKGEEDVPDKTSD